MEGITMSNMTLQNTLVTEVGSMYIGPEKKTSTHGKLILADGTIMEGTSFGYEGATTGEVVFSTGMVGYPEALTDASFAGQILNMTYPLIGNYGVPDRSYWESDKVHIAGLIVSNYTDEPSHRQSIMNLGTWLQGQKVPALEIKDTRFLTKHIRTHGAMLGKIVFDNDIPFHDPNTDNLVAQVSNPRISMDGSGDITLALLDCGAKHNIVTFIARTQRSRHHSSLGLRSLLAHTRFRL